MQWKQVGLAAATLVSLAAGRAVGQGVALLNTPVGALAPLVPDPASQGGTAFDARVSHWQFGPGDDPTTVVGLGLSTPVGRTRVTFDLGLANVKQCPDCQHVLAGVNVNVPLAEWGSPAAHTAVGSIGLDPAVGISRNTGGGSFNVWSAAVTLPVSVSVPAGGSWRWVPFVAPGVGFGGLTNQPSDVAPAAGIFGSGIALSKPGAIQLTLSAQMIVDHGSVTTYGLGVSFGR